MLLWSVALCLTIGTAFSHETMMLFPFNTQTTDPHESFVEASNAFAIHLYKHLVSRDGNIFFCPACLMSSMTMLMEGSSEKTEVELNRTLGFKANGLQREMVRAAFKELNQRIERTECLSHMANALLVQKESWGIPTDFKEDSSDLYNTLVTEVDFANNPQQAVWDINELVRSKTSGFIKRIFERVDTNSQMLLLNAVHFRTKFIDIFDSNTSLKKRFYNHGVEDHDLYVFMMEKKGGIHKVANSYDFRALELPCGDNNETDVKLWIFLPHKVGALTDVEDGLSTATFQHIKNSFLNLEIDIAIPRIRFDFTKDISQELQRLGMNQIFSSDEADFKDISDKEHLALTQVLQKTLVEINEMRLLSTIPKPAARKDTLPSGIPPFVVNHPFLFCVVDKVSGLILYLGRVIEF